MSNSNDFKLNDSISVTLKGRKITGKLIGVDTYSLESFDGDKTGWPSYTLVSDRKDKFGRYWFVRWGDANWILWLQAKSMTVPKGAKLIPAKSGIAKIEFEGDAGVSTPHAALIQYKTNDGYYSAERFAGSEVLYFSGHKIPKPKVEPGG
jgi:hypothetical protein